MGLSPSIPRSVGFSQGRSATMKLRCHTRLDSKIDTCTLEPNLDDQLKQFWELESLGITENEASVYDKFVQQIRFDGQRYEVSLPWSASPTNP